MNNTAPKSSGTKSKILSVIILTAFVLTLVSCSSPRCGYMKHYNRDVRMGIAH